MNKIKPEYTINLDFDGTVVTHNYPYIGKDIGAIPVLKKLTDNKIGLILFTIRSGQQLQDAVDWFKKHNIPLYGIQKDPLQELWTSSNKSYAPLMIDDSALGCPLMCDESISDRPFVDWLEVEIFLKNKNLI